MNTSKKPVSCSMRPRERMFGKESEALASLFLPQQDALLKLTTGVHDRVQLKERLRTREASPVPRTWLVGKLARLARCATPQPPGCLPETVCCWVWPRGAAKPKCKTEVQAPKRHVHESKKPRGVCPAASMLHAVASKFCWMLEPCAYPAAASCIRQQCNGPFLRICRGVMTNGQTNVQCRFCSADPPEHLEGRFVPCRC